MARFVDLKQGYIYFVARVVTYDTVGL
jgi:hypothetical protein